MDFELSEEQLMIKESAREWCNRHMPFDKIREMEINGYPYPKDIPKGLGEQGYIMGVVPEEHGGLGLDWLTQSLISEEIGYADPTIATAAAFMAVGTGWGYVIDKFASEGIREKFIRPAIKGEKFVGIAATEPSGGSVVANHKSYAVKDGDEWVLNGEKTFISGVEEAREWGGGYWTNVRTGDPAGGSSHKHMTAFFVPVDSEGFHPDVPYRDAGRHSLSTSGFRMENVRVPENYMLGEKNKGFYGTMEGFDNARILIGASAVGVTERLLDVAMKYIKERHTFGKPLAKYEGIQFELVKLYREMEATRLLCYKTAWMQDKRYQEGKYKPKEVAKWISMIKWKAPHLALKAANQTMHWLGAAGYTDEYPIEMAWRGVMSYCVGAEGGANIQKIVIGRELLGPEYIPYR